jgi:hypothetical protein
MQLKHRTQQLQFRRPGELGVQFGNEAGLGVPTPRRLAWAI